MTNSIEDFVSDRKSVQTLVYAIVKQAITDWRDLCRYGPNSHETPSKNFDELTYFFQHGCNGMISQGTADRIYAELLKMREA